MAKLLLIFSILILLHALMCSATVYTVGDSSGWDISTDVDSWAKGKTFSVGDILLFQYSKYYSVNEVTRENYDGCNTTNFLQSSSNGNSTFTLTRPVDWYFVCGNRLYCLGGMKLHVNVIGNQAASPAGAPQPQQPGGSLPSGSSKSNNPTSGSSSLNRISIHSLLVAFFSSLIISFSVM